MTTPAFDAAPAPAVLETPAAVVSVPAEAAESVAKIIPSFDIMMKGLAKMTDTTAFSPDKAQAVFGDISARAKTAAEKGTKFVEELSELTKGNVEALVASGKIAAKGAEDFGAEAAAYSKASFEKTTGVFKSLATVKSPAELMQIQSEFAKSSFDSLIAESSKLTEAYVKFASDVFQPISSRFAVVGDKIKTAAL